jgi:hypothetical protein
MGLFALRATQRSAEPHMNTAKLGRRTAETPDCGRRLPPGRAVSRRRLPRRVRRAGAARGVEILEPRVCLTGPDAACSAPIADSDFPELTSDEAGPRLLLLRERAHADAPDLSDYGISGEHDFVASLMLHTAHGTDDSTVTAATITFSPGVVILGTITRSDKLGNERDDALATHSDADFGIFDASASDPNWDRYSGDGRGLEPRDDITVLHDGTNGSPAQFRLEFHTGRSRDQSRVLIDYGTCWLADASATVAFEAIEPDSGETAFERLLVAGETFGGELPITVALTGPAPPAPTITGFSSDSGVPGDHITSDDALTVTGSAVAHGTVTVFFNGALQGSTTADAAGDWSFDAPSMPDGDYTITAKVETPGGRSALSGSLVVTIDTSVPPVPTITGFSTDSGVAGDRITNDATLSVTGTAEPNHMVTVRFNGVAQGTAQANAVGNWSFDAPAQADGVYAITATAQDVAGNTSAASGSLEVTIDTSLPAAPTITGFSTDTGTPGDFMTGDNSLTVTGTAEPGSTVAVFFNGAVQGTVTGGGDGTWSFAAGAKPDGVQVITATAQDAAGNTSAASGPLAVTIDTAAPAAPIITGFSADSGELGDLLTSDNTLTVTGTAEAASTVTVLFDGVSQGTVAAGGDGAWTFHAGPKPDGRHAIIATAQDAAGNTSAASGPLAVTIDTTAPAAPVIAGFATDTGTPGDGITNDNTPTVTGTAEPGSTVSVSCNGLGQGTTTAAADGSWTLSLTPQPDGPCAIRATATDAAGNTSGPADPLAITIDTAAPAAPAVTGFATDTGIPGDHITSDNLLAVRGTAEPGSAVTVFCNEFNQGTTTAAADGSWTLNLALQPDGPCAVTATAQDAAGNTSAASSPLVVTIDTVAPAAPAVTGYSIDSGLVGDLLTNDNTLTITGTAEPSSTVTVFFGGVAQGTAPAGGDGAWTFHAEPKPDGLYAITATAQDAAGNNSAASSPLRVTIDTTAPGAPTISDFATDTGTPDDRITNDNTLWLTGSAEPGSTVTVLFNSAAQGVATAGGDGAWTFHAGSKPDDVYQITATAQDAAGNTGAASDPLVVTIDTAPPAAPAITGFSNDTGTTDDRITSDNTLTVTGTAEPGSTVTVFFDGIAQGTTTAPSGTWTFAAAPKRDGTYQIMAAAQDAAGNAGAASDPLDVTIDTAAPAAPTITGFSRDSGLVGDQLTNDNTLTITGVAEPGSTVHVLFNDAMQGSATAGGDGAWTFNAAPKPDGAYRITATAQDAAGNTSAASGPLVVTIDATAPVTPTITGFSADTGTPGDRITSDNALSVAGTAEPGSVVAVFCNGLSQGTTTAAADGSWSLDLHPQPDGVCAITAAAQDAAGNSSPSSGPLVVTIDTAAPAVPAIIGFSTDSGPVGDQLTNDRTLAISGTAEAASTVTVFFDGVVQGTTTAAGDGAWTFGAASKPDGTYQITATAQDAAGNTGAASGPLSVTIDTTAPAAPMITGFSADTGTAGDRITSDNTLSVVGTAEPGSVVTVFCNGLNQGTATASADGSWSLDLPPQPDGVCVVTAAAQDAAGNTNPAASALVVTVDTTAPAAPVISGFSEDSGIAGDQITSDSTLTVSGSAEAGSTVTLLFDGTAQGATTAAADGRWSFSAAPKPDGVYAISATARDAAGNLSAAPGSLAVTIDSAAPAAPAITGFSTDTGTAGDAATSDNSLTITGTAEPGSSVTVLFDGAAQGSASAAADGSWTFSAAPKPDGIYQISATAHDDAGNASAASGPLVVTINTAIPAAPAITGFFADTANLGDRITSDNTLTVTGTAAPGSTVTAFCNASSQGTTNTAPDGSWLLNLPPQPDGVCAITATAQNVVGTVSAHSAPLVVTVDTTAPAAPAITGFSEDTGVAGDRITGDDTLTVTGTAEPGSTVSVFFNGTAQGTTTAPLGTWMFNAGPKPDGLYLITASASDAAGNGSAASTPLTVTIDTLSATCGTPRIDRDFSELTPRANGSPLAMTYEQAFSAVPDLSAYGAFGSHDYVQSLMFHSSHGEKRKIITAATVTFTPGVTILTTITSAASLGGNKDDHRATQSDALFGVFGNPAQDLAWDRYSGPSRGLERPDSVAIIHDGRNGLPAQIELVFSTDRARDQARVIVDHGNCWQSGEIADVEFHEVPVAPKGKGRQKTQAATLAAAGANRAHTRRSSTAPTVDRVLDDNGASAIDRVTSDRTPMLSGTSGPGSSVRVSLNARVVDTVLADDTGAWSYLSPELEPGKYRLRVTNLSQGTRSDPFRFTII